jgi:hypothetical protein
MDTGPGGPPAAPLVLPGPVSIAIPALVYGNTDHAALRLITCGGPFDSAGHYRDNVVVLASLVAG